MLDASRYKPTFLGLVILLTLLTGQISQAASPKFQKSAGLFEDAYNVGNQAVDQGPTIMRSRLVKVKFDLLGGPADVRGQASIQPEVQDVVTLNLFDDATYTAVLDQIEVLATGGYVWIGHIDDVLYSQVVFVVNQGQAAGNVALPNGFYAIRYVSNNTHVIYQIDQSRFPDDLVRPVVLPAEPPPIQAMADDGSQIDVMVLYTGDARQAAGGTTAIQNLINLAVTETNQSYANSGVNHRLQLVHTEEVNYTESGNIETDLDRLTGTGDGFMDNAHTLRNTHQADLAALIVENGGGFCGIANLMTTVSAAFESKGFSVTARNCATGYYSFGHELGHNMGARHDWYVDPTDNSPFSYNHAYVNTTDRWRTVMGYNAQCSDSGFNCTRLPYWSNPNVSYNGAPMGIPEGSANAAENYKTLNNTALTVANFRDSGGTPPTTGPLVYNGNILDDDSNGNSSGNNDGLADCGEIIEGFVYLRNQGSNTATGVNATISTSSSYVTFPFNTTSGYADIAGSSSQLNSNDFEFQVAANTPNGHQIQFTLDVTANNGGPWSANFVVPVTCNPSSGDDFEPDNDSTEAKAIADGEVQTHSIYPVGDQDWVVFSPNGNTGLVLETSGTSGDDTRMWLYDSSLVELAFNDDIDQQNGNYFSRIRRQCDTDPLPAGTYYVKVDEYNNDDTIASYNLALTLTPCDDIYEPDNNSSQAISITSGNPQVHSIQPANDQDWVTFTLDSNSTVALETSGGSGDTRMWLYDNGLNQLEFDDDDGIGFFSYIDRLCGIDPLPAGVYYVRIDEYENDDVIAMYEILMTAAPCNVYLPFVMK
jgi:peptidyl-Asp metalloendopeptidase